MRKRKLNTKDGEERGKKFKNDKLKKEIKRRKFYFIRVYI
jgi:hypothetical protein